MNKQSRTILSRLPAKRKPPRVSNRVQLEWPRHRRWVKSHGCCVPGCLNPDIEMHHVRNAANAGTAIKPHDAFGVSLCREHHAEHHRTGAKSFEAKYGVDLMDKAAVFRARSPDQAMKDSLKLRENHDADAEQQ